MDESPWRKRCISIKVRPLLSTSVYSPKLAEVFNDCLAGLLRAVDRNITSVTGNHLWRNFIASEFRKHRDDTDASRIQQHLQLAKDYAFLITSVREHKVRACTHAGYQNRLEAFLGCW